MAAATKTKATEAQVATLDLFVRTNEGSELPDERVEAWLEEDGTMGLSHTADGLTMVGFFGTDGKLQGDWLV